MAADEPSGTRPAPVVLRIKLRYDDVEGLVARFAPNIGKSGLFLPTKTMQPLGTEVKFELRLTTDAPVLVGLGRVKAATPPDPANPRATFGLALELMRVTPPSKAVILQILERRKQLGLPEIAVPLAADVDAARRVDVETGPRETPIVPAPPPERDSHPVLDARPGTTSAPVLTAPRGAVAVARSTAVAALAPEPPQRPRPPVHEVIERASGPIALVVEAPALDDAAVAAVVARARALAAGPLDADLAALRDSGAAPFEISIEAASAELARQLGGVAVTRDRSARWAPPPTPVSAALALAPVPVGVPAVVAAPEPAVEPEPEVVAPEAAASEAAEVEAAEAAAEDEAIALLDALDDAPVLVAEVVAAPGREVAPEVTPDQIADEILRLGDADVEEVEHTQIGVMPEPEDLRAMFSARPDPAAERELERQLAAQLEAAEADEEDLGFAAAAAAIAEAVAANDPPGPVLVLLPDAELPATGDDFVIPLSGADFVIPLSGADFVLPPVDPADALEAEAALDAAGSLAEAVAAAEIDDAEILAEADAGDADLLAGFAPGAAADLADEGPYHAVPADLDRPPLDDTGDLGGLDALAAYEEPPLTLDADAFGSLDLRRDSPRRDSPRRDSVVELRVPRAAYAEAPLHLPSDALGDGMEDLREEATSFATPDFLASFGAAPTAYAAPGSDAPIRLSESDFERPSVDSAIDALAGFADEEEGDEEGEAGHEAVIGAVLDHRYGMAVGADPSALYTTPIELLEDPSDDSIDGSIELSLDAPLEEPDVAQAGEFDLESALDALDVDLDDLSMPHAKTELPSSTRRRKIPAQRSSSVSIDIDLDDDT